MDQDLPPPVQAAELDAFAEPSTWPTVVGTISIVWASLNMLCGGCGVLSPVLMSTFMKSAEAQMGPMPDVMKPGALQIGLAGVGLLWAIMLLAAGIMLTLRKPVSRALHLAYAGGAVVLTVVAVVVSFMIQTRIAEWVASNPDNKWAQQQNATMSWAMLGISIVLGLAWPVFCLIWFGLVKRDAAAISGGEASVV
jgi:hypothetical protein